MRSVLKNRFSASTEVFLVLCLLTLFDFVLLGYRLNFIEFDRTQVKSIDDIVRLRGIPTFLFLVWNLFLAWVPYLLSLGLRTIKNGRGRRIKTILILGLWLLFFPNAPYILTDLLHFGASGDLPKWYDLMLLLSFAFTGLMLGWISLMEVQRFLRSCYPAFLTHIFSSMALILCSYGIYLGRFQRWNSWDVFTRPGALLQDMFSVLAEPSAHAGTLGISVVLGGFLLIGYRLLQALQNLEK